MQPAPYPQGTPQQPFAPPPRRGSSVLKIVLIVIGCGLIFMCVLGSIGIPAFIKYMRRAKTMEAVERTAYLCRAMDAFAQQNGSLPPPAPRTPDRVPAGIRVMDPPGTWAQGTWAALQFAMSDPHYYSYEISTAGSLFRVRAYGDLDGNGVTSTFERGGQLGGSGGASCASLVEVRPTE